MLKRSLFVAALGLAVGLTGDLGCKGKTPTETPDDDSLGGGKKKGPKGPGEEDESSLSYESPEEGADGEPAEVGLAEGGEEAESKLNCKPEIKEVCKGKGKKKECKQVDKNAKNTAQCGVMALTKGYKWGMTPEDVLAQLGKAIEAEYAAKQKKASDAMTQDRNRKWKQDQLQDLKKGHIKFTKSARHKWGVSLVQYDFEDDANEEMVWTRDRTLRKFFFFKDGELWKIVYAFNVEKWPGKQYEEVVDANFKKWFGISPEGKLKVDPKDQRPLLRYYEWEAADGARIRSFDQSAVHGVFVLSVVNGLAEDNIGERLPNASTEEKFSDDVGDILGGSDVKYDEDGNIVEGKPPEADVE
ncbi:MAG: hypothetical protein KC636_07290 [Myxococcales bacterium]|nr:hypothetical protein [Myxococcales bacterium]